MSWLDLVEKLERGELAEPAKPAEAPLAPLAGSIPPLVSENISDGPLSVDLQTLDDLAEIDRLINLWCERTKQAESMRDRLRSLRYSMAGENVPEVLARLQSLH